MSQFTAEELFWRWWDGLNGTNSELCPEDCHAAKVGWLAGFESGGAELQKQLDQVVRKIDHGCTDANCGLCDNREQEPKRGNN